MNKVETYGRGEIFIIALKSVIKAVLITAAAMLVLALFITYTDIPEAAVNGCITAATVLSVLIAGFASARKKAGAGWLSGLITGIIYVLIIVAVGFLVLDEAAIGADTAKMLALSVASGIVGGILGINFRGKRK